MESESQQIWGEDFSDMQSNACFRLLLVYSRMFCPHFGSE